MLRRVEQSLEEIRRHLLDMAGRVEEMIAEADRALTGRDSQLAENVILSDPRVDAMEKQIDEECLLLLALQEPKAVDLRFLIAVQKIIGDLERMGDSAVNIAQSVLRLNTEPPLKSYVDLPHLSERAREMVREALDAFVRGDAELARAVCRKDDAVDDLYHELFAELVDYMKKSPGNVERGLQLLLVARNLERIADHATNVAEDVIFYLEAKDIRHSATSSAIKALSPTGAGSE